MRFCCFLFFALVGCTEPKDQLFTNGKPLGKVSKKLEEASGLAASVRNPGYLWTLNDSGNPAEVFLIDQQADIKLTCKLPTAVNRDWEEIRVSIEDSISYVYVADIGDNEARYELKFIYRFQEPALTEERILTFSDIDTLILRMPDGKRDSETIMIDPLTHDLFILSKREDSISFYRAQYPFAGDTLVPERLFRMPFKNIVSGDISPDGQEVVLKNYDEIFYWKKSGQESIAELLKRTPTELPYRREKQGEAITWALDGTGFYTLGESSKDQRAQLIFYKRK
jgi:hypothetical protein